MQNSAILVSRSLIAIGGEDATGFLQNLITCDVEELPPNKSAFGALLTPQGKILFDFLVHRTDDGFLLDVAGDQAPDLAKRLMFYRLRAKVDIELLDQAVHINWPAADDSVYADPRGHQLGYRTIGAENATANEADWDRHRIELGFPECGKDFAGSDVFPHEALMDQFGPSGVDFSKGCYVGQEVVSRMQHRGTARSRFVKVNAASGRELPDLGAQIKADERALGTMGSHSGSAGLALLRLDRTATATNDGQQILADDTAITVALPSFVSFDWPK